MCSFLQPFRVRVFNVESTLELWLSITSISQRRPNPARGNRNSWNKIYAVYGHLIWRHSECCTLSTSICSTPRGSTSSVTGLSAWSGTNGWRPRYWDMSCRFVRCVLGDKCWYQSSWQYTPLLSRRCLKVMERECLHSSWIPFTWAFLATRTSGSVPVR